MASSMEDTTKVRPNRYWKIWAYLLSKEIQSTAVPNTQLSCKAGVSYGLPLTESIGKKVTRPPWIDFK